MLIIFILFIASLNSINCLDLNKLKKLMDRFIFDIEISCQNNTSPYFWYEIRFFKECPTCYPYGYPITGKYKEYHLPLGTHKRQYWGSTGIDDPFGPRRRVYAEILHNCTNSHMDWKYISTLTFNHICPGGLCHYGVHADLATQWGTKTIDVVLKNKAAPTKQ